MKPKFEYLDKVKILADGRIGVIKGVGRSYDRKIFYIVKSDTKIQKWKGIFREKELKLIEEEV